MKLAVKVTPNAPRNAIAGYRDGELLVKIAAPAVDGKANKELVRFLSEISGVAKSEISVPRGETSRHKLVELPEAAAKALIEAASRS